MHGAGLTDFFSSAWEGAKKVYSKAKDVYDHLKKNRYAH